MRHILYFYLLSIVKNKYFLFPVILLVAAILKDIFGYIGLINQYQYWMLTYVIRILLIPTFLLLIHIEMGVKEAIKEFYYTLPYDREILFVTESLSSIFIVATFLLGITYNEFFSVGIDLYLLLKLVIGIFLIGFSVTILSDLNWSTVLKLLFTILILPLTIDTMGYIYPTMYMEILNFVMELMPHRILIYAIGLNHIQISSFNVYASALYDAILIYIGLWYKERLNIL